MTRNILELKSMDIPLDEVMSFDVARQSPDLREFDLREYFFRPVYHPRDYFENYHYYMRGELHEEVVCVKKIMGTTHDSYHGKNWLEMLMTLKRHRSDHDEGRVIAAINDTQVADRISLSKYGDAYFIDGGGNHRVCQAKILNLETVPCEVTEFIFNEGAYSRSQRLKAIKEIDPSFTDYPVIDNESSILVQCLGLLVSLHFCDEEIAILERIINLARLAAKNPIKRVWNKMLFRRSCMNCYTLSRAECLKPLYRELIVRVDSKRNQRS